MGRISLFEVLKRQNKLQEVIDNIKDNESDKALEWICNFVKCSAPAAKKLYNEIKKNDINKERLEKSLIQIENCIHKPLEEIISQPVKITKADLKEVKRNDKKPLWAVCTKPLRGIYVRPNDKGENEEYKHVSLYLGTVHSDTEKEAIELAKKKYDTLPVLDEASYFAFKVVL